MGRPTSFEEVARQADPELRQLLRDGTAPERTWAAWALAQRVQGASISFSSLRGEPHAGARRHLVTVAASQREDEVVVAIAHHDPDAAVRATATMLAAQLAAAGRVAWEVIAGGLDDPSPEVRAKVIDALPPTMLEMLVAHLVRDGAPQVRWSAFERLVAMNKVELIVATLEACDVAEQSARLTRMVARAGLAATAIALAGATADHKLLLLEQLEAPSWDEIAPMLGDDEPALTARLLELFHDQVDQLPVRLQLHLIARSRWIRNKLANEALEQLRAWPGETFDRELVIKAVRSCDGWLTAYDEWRADEAWERYDEVAKARWDSERPIILALRDELVSRAR